jgi:hypothetical protein
VEAARNRHEKLYRKVMLIHGVLVSSEVREAMVDPTGWRPELPNNLSLET